MQSNSPYRDTAIATAEAPRQRKGRGKKGKFKTDESTAPTDAPSERKIKGSFPPPSVPTPSHLGQSKVTTITPSKFDVPVDFFGNTFDYSMTPVDNRVEYAIDASSYLDIVESTYAALRTVDSKFATQVPYCLYSYYCIQLFWYRAYYVCNQNRSLVGQQIDTFIENFSNLQPYVPKILELWLNGLGNTISPFGDLVYARLPVKPDSHGRFGEISAARAAHYVSLPAPQIAVEYIAQSIAHQAVAPLNPEWNPGDIVPQNPPAGRAYRSTPNLLGWSRIRSLPRKSRQVLEDLGWQAYPAMPAFTEPLRFHMKTMVHVSLYLQQVTQRYEIVPLTMLSPNGSTNVIPYLLAGEFETHERVSADDVAHISQYQLAPLAAANSFLFGYRIQRYMYSLRRSAALPLFYYETAHPDIRIDLPVDTDLNANFLASTGHAYLDQIFFRGIFTRRVDRIDTVCAKYVKGS